MSDRNSIVKDAGDGRPAEHAQLLSRDVPDGLEVVEPGYDAAHDAPQLAAVEYIDRESKPELYHPIQPDAPYEGGPSKGYPPPTLGGRVSTWIKDHRRLLAILLVLLVLIAVVVPVAVTQTVGKDKTPGRTKSDAPSPSESGAAESESEPSKPNSSPSSSQQKHLGKTGMSLAALADGSGRISAYAQLPTGELVEHTYLPNGTWVAASNSSSVVTKYAKDGTPIAAISYIHNFTLTRRVFYVDNAGIVAEAMKNGTGAWTQPQWAGSLYDLKREATETPSINLAACWSDRWLGDPDINRGGIRIYYGYEEIVQELYWGVTKPHYINGPSFDVKRGSGVACTTNGSSILNVYVQNRTTADLQQYWFDYNPNNDHGKDIHIWRKGLTWTGLDNVKKLSAVNDGTRDIIHYQNLTSQVVRQLRIFSDAERSRVLPADVKELDQVELGTALKPTKFSSAIVDGKMHVLYQTGDLEIRDTVVNLGADGTKPNSTILPVKKLP
ncbi:MAG: hypothetical protein M1832_006133 [Thelocarpon impressellum]|nr:MAG: hypothetical protein M1832_006133 [Thelocarpon impressellum]